MRKTNFVLGLFICILAYLLIGLFSPVRAASVVQIQQLPGYINYTDFKLSCTTDGSSAQFYSKKDGGSYTAFGPAISISSSTPCQVNVTGSQFGSEGKFWFEVIVDGGPASTINNNETVTTLDTTAPGPVIDFSKSRTAGNTVYHLSWKNPLDSDFTKTMIYRGTVAGFEADDSHKIAEAGGSPGDTMTYDDGSLDPNTQYYYYIRAVDHANNSSSLVGDYGTTTVVTSPSPRPAGNVTVLPKEQGTGGGSVLGTEQSPTPEASISPQGGLTGSINQFASTQTGLLKWILTHKKISLGLLIIIGLLIYYYYRSKRLK